MTETTTKTPTKAELDDATAKVKETEAAIEQLDHDHQARVEKRRAKHTEAKKGLNEKLARRKQRLADLQG